MISSSGLAAPRRRLQRDLAEHLESRPVDPQIDHHVDLQRDADVEGDRPGRRCRVTRGAWMLHACAVTLATTAGALAHRAHLELVAGDRGDRVRVRFSMTATSKKRRPSILSSSGTAVRCRHADPGGRTVHGGYTTVSCRRSRGRSAALGFLPSARPRRTQSQPLRIRCGRNAIGDQHRVTTGSVTLTATWPPGHDGGASPRSGQRRDEFGGPAGPRHRR